MRSEITILNMIEHPFLIKMNGIAQDSKYLYILLEFIPGGELFTYLRTIQSLKHEDARFYAS
jgi:serine/threonine protein kinase